MSVVVSIGVPVYNGQGTIKQAIESILSQSLTEIEVIVSDNASTDETGQICEELARLDHRVLYIRQAVNIGASENFRFVLKQARGEYFLWAAADDLRSPDFLEKNVKYLSEHLDCVASTCPNRFAGQGADRNVTFSLMGTGPERFQQFFANCWRSHGIFYSVIRTEVLRECDVLRRPFWAADWAVDLFLASRGNVNRTSDGLAVFGSAGASSRPDAYRAFRSRPVEVFLPFFPLSAYAFGLSRSFTLIDRLSLLARLFVLNVRGAYDQAFSLLYQLYKVHLRPLLRRQ